VATGVWITKEGHKFHIMEAICVVLRRFAYPSRLGDLVPMFHRSKTALSLIFSEITEFLAGKYKEIIHFDGVRLAGNLQRFADSIHQKGAPLTNCWAFIDGTVRPIARPVWLQKVVFNGHKRVHALKFQSLVTPDGLIAHIYSPIEGRRHDCALLKLSLLCECLKAHPEFENFVIYGDSAYPVSSQFISPFKGAHLTADMAEFNKRMSGSRIAVE